MAALSGFRARLRAVRSRARGAGLTHPPGSPPRDLSPAPVPPPGARPPPSAPPRGCGPGLRESRGPRADPSRRPQAAGPPLPPASGAPWPGAGHSLAAGFPSPEAGGVGGGSCCRRQLGSRLGGPWGGPRGWLQEARDASPCFWGLSGRAPADGSPVYMSARAGFPSSSHFCGRFSRSELPGLTGRPARFPAGAGRVPAAWVRAARHTALEPAAAPGKGSQGPLKGGPAPFGSASPKVAGQTLSPATPLTPHLGVGCQVQPTGTAEGLGFHARPREG